MFENYFSLSYDGPPFIHGSVEHVSAVGAVLATCALLAVGLRGRANTRSAAFARHGLACFALLNVCAWYLWEWQVGLSSLAFSLPIQICTASTILCPLMLWSRSYRLFELIYFWGMAGVAHALLTPDIGQFGFPHFVFLIFFTSHGVVPACVVFMLVAEGYRPRWSSLGRAVVISLGFVALAGLANWLTGGNYLFIARKPPFPTLIDHLGAWPWYIPALLAIGIASFVVVYLPFALGDSARRRSANSAHAAAR